MERELLFFPYPIQEWVFLQIFSNIFSIRLLRARSTPTMSTKVGIGLYIVKHTIDLHHGMVKVDSEPGRGSIFTLYIPTGKEHFIEDIYETGIIRFYRDRAL